jgi:hypothetical protein
LHYSAQAKETLERQQEQYRKAYDAHKKLRNAKVKADDFYWCIESELGQLQSDNFQTEVESDFI